MVKSVSSIGNNITVKEKDISLATSEKTDGNICIFETDASKKSDNETVVTDTVQNQQKLELSKVLSSMGKGALMGFMLAGTIFAIDLFLCRRIGKPKQLAKYINFKPAKTLEEAKKFAKNQLKIKKFKINDLDIANFINEGLVNANNRCGGNAFIPDIVKWTTKKNASMACLTTFGKRHLYVNRTNIKSELDVYETILNASKAFNIDVSNINPFLDIYHELGHFQRGSTLPANYLFSTNRTGFLGIKGKLTKEFLKNPEKQRIAGMVSKYAQTAPEEFCAEVYALLIDNSKQIPKEVMDLYKSYSGQLIK